MWQFNITRSCNECCSFHNAICVLKVYCKITKNIFYSQEKSAKIMISKLQLLAIGIDKNPRAAVAQNESLALATQKLSFRGVKA